MPMAVTMRVEGTPKTRWFQKVRSYALRGARRACSHTIRFAAEPSKDRLPATVLTHASRSHDRVTAAGEMSAAADATSPPIRSTAFIRAHHTDNQPQALNFVSRFIQSECTQPVMLQAKPPRYGGTTRATTSR
ncbi:unnamed protein product [Urochloa decumbens]|uniref:Uncharacterized protein n=1 Tax=Urochloa decumbens TaxID=240449 RepID=A0ABC8WM85_9POAL